MNDTPEEPIIELVAPGEHDPRVDRMDVQVGQPDPRVDRIEIAHGEHGPRIDRLDVISTPPEKIPEVYERLGIDYKPTAYKHASRGKFSPEMYIAIKMSAGYGLRIPQLAAIAGLPTETFEKRMARDRALRRAIDEGRALAELEVSRTLFDKAVAGDVNAIKWYEQTRNGRATKEETTTNVNFDFTAAVAKFEMLASKARMLEDRSETTARIVEPPPANGDSQ
jgi:hypothetical protein